jgi:adenylate cyclase
MARVWLGKTRNIQQFGLLLAGSITLAVGLLALIEPDLLVTPFRRIESATIDFRFRVFRGPRPATPDIVIVVVDEPSIKEIGRWPWSRMAQARLVEGIAQRGAKVIGLDVIYSEPEVTELKRGLQEIRAGAQAAGAARAVQGLLDQKLRESDTDAQFEQQVRKAGNVVLALPLVVPVSDSCQPVVSAPPKYITSTLFMMVKQASSGAALEPQCATSAVPPLRQFAAAAASLGHVYTIPDRDGVTRYEYLAVRYGDDRDYYPSLGLEVARIYLGVPRDHMSLTLGEGVRLGKVLIPTDQKARMLINHVGKEQSFRYVSAADVIHGRVEPDAFAGKAVFVGTAALGTYDQKTTPFSANFPGVEKNATVAENIITQQFLEQSVYDKPIDLMLILFFGFGLGVYLPKMRAIPGAMLASVAFLGYAAVAQYLFVSQGLLLAVVFPLFTILAVFVAVTVLRFMTEEKQAKEVRAMFSSYVSPRIVEELIKDPTKAKLGGQRKELTMLFSDVKGFTTLCEQHPPEQVVPLLNEYLTAMTEVVFHWNGTLDKFIGDAVVAFWGAPIDQPNHVELALKCALHMRRRLGELQEGWKARGMPLLDNGIGINTGDALVGNIGAEGKKMDYTMIGDHVNLAARAEGLTRKFGVSVVITENTAERLKGLLDRTQVRDTLGRVGRVDLRRLAIVKVKGKAKPVGIYALTSRAHGERSVVTEDEATAEVIEMTDK